MDRDPGPAVHGKDGTTARGATRDRVGARSFGGALHAADGPLAALLAVATFVTVAAAAWIVVTWATTHPPAVPPVQAPVTNASQLPPAFRGWAHWDATWYASISRDGYSYRPGTASSVAFFPTYPLVIRALDDLFPGGSPYELGSLVTLAAGIGASLLLYRWSRHWLAPPGAATAVLLLALYPYSIYLFGPVYADALFLAGTLAAFVLLEADHLLAATLVAAVTSATRPAGIVVGVVLILRHLERRGLLDRPMAPRQWLRRFDRRDATVLLGVSGFLGYCAYLGLRFGEPLAFAATESAPGWDQGPGLHTWAKISFFTELARDPTGPAALGLLLQLAFAVGALATVPAVRRRFGVAYAALVLLVAAMPLVATKDFQGTGRYLLPAFPVLALAGDALAHRPRLRVLCTVVGVPVVLLFSSWFAKGNYLA